MDAPLIIAFTYDAISEWSAQGFSEAECAQFQTDETIEQIASALGKIGKVDRVGTLKSLVQRLASGVRQPWDIVFNYAESFGGVSREGHVPGLLDAYQYNYTFSDPSVLILCTDKPRCKMVLDHHGVPTAPFACVPPRVDWSAEATAQSMTETYVWKSRHGEALRQFPLFVKPGSDNSGVGIQQRNKVNDEAQLAQAIERVADQFPDQSVLIERFLQGREFTVGIMGTGAQARVIGVMELAYLAEPTFKDPRITVDSTSMGIEVYGDVFKYFYASTFENQHLPLSDPLAVEVGRTALEAWKALGCRDCGRIDIRYDKKGDGAVPNIIEINPIPGLTAGWSDLSILAKDNGIDYDTLIASIVKGALGRVQPDKRPAHGDRLP